MTGGPGVAVGEGKKRKRGAVCGWLRVGCCWAPLGRARAGGDNGPSPVGKEREVRLRPFSTFFCTDVFLFSKQQTTNNF